VKKEDEAIEMFVAGLVLDPATQAPIVILKDETGEVVLPIWIGMAEATSIATVMKNLTLQRPITHDLMFNAFEQIGIKIERMMITDLQESTYFAELVLVQGERKVILDSRPSDAIALAIRAAAPIFVASKVLLNVKIAVGEAPTHFSNPKEPTIPGDVAESEIAEIEGEKDFRNVDKDKWAEILAELDPDDFKYKM